MSQIGKEMEGVAAIIAKTLRERIDAAISRAKQYRENMYDLQNQIDFLTEVCNSQREPLACGHTICPYEPERNKENDAPRLGLSDTLIQYWENQLSNALDSSKRHWRELAQIEAELFALRGWSNVPRELLPCGHFVCPYDISGSAFYQEGD